MPDYVIEPPDILMIDAIKVVPKSPYRVESLDLLAISVPVLYWSIRWTASLWSSRAAPSTWVPPYGSVQVAGLDLREASRVIENNLREFLADPTTHISLCRPGPATDRGRAHGRPRRQSDLRDLRQGFYHGADARAGPAGH